MQLFCVWLQSESWAVLSAGTVRVSHTLPKLYHLLYLHWSSPSTFSIPQASEVSEIPSHWHDIWPATQTAQLPAAKLAPSPSVKSTCTSSGVFFQPFLIMSLKSFAAACSAAQKMWAKPKPVKEAEQLQVSPALQGLGPFLHGLVSNDWVDDPFSNPLPDQQVTSSLSLFPQTPEVMREEEKSVFFRQNLPVFEGVVEVSACGWCWHPFGISLSWHKLLWEKAGEISSACSDSWIYLWLKRRENVFLANKPHLLELKLSFKGCKKVKCCRIKKYGVLCNRNILVSGSSKLRAGACFTFHLMSWIISRMIFLEMLQ